MKRFLFLFFIISCSSEESRLGDTFYANKNYEEAINQYSESLNLEPNDIQSLYRRGRSYEELKMYDKAEKDYKKILDIDNKNVNALLSLSVHYIRNKNYQKFFI